MNLPLALLLGLVFGLVAWWRCFYSVIQYLEVRRAGGSLAQAGLRLLLGSGLWVVLGVAALGPYVLTRPQGPESLRWGLPFFAAFGVAALPAAMLAVLGMRRRRAAARRAQRRGRLGARRDVEGE